MSRRNLMLLGVLLITACGGGGGGDDDDDTTCTTTFHADGDGDGFGDPAASMVACSAPQGYVADGTDCDDTAGAVHPGVSEVCDGLDNDCNGKTDSDDPGVDLATAHAYYRDQDGDGFGNDAVSLQACDQPAGYVNDRSDCNDQAGAVHPGATEVCNDFVDDDCDELSDDDDPGVDRSGVPAVYADGDGDQFGSGDPIVLCHPAAGVASVNGDCDDAAFAVHPGATEVCNGADDDCDGGNDGTPAQPDQCNAFVGTFTGSYSLTAVEQVGATVLHTMSCTGGSSSVTVDLGAAHVVHGTTSCHYGGSLGGFDDQQFGTIDGVLAIDGSFQGTLVHEYSQSSFDVGERTYSFIHGVISGGTLTITGEGGLLPNEFATVPWDVDYSVAGNR